MYLALPDPPARGLSVALCLVAALFVSACGGGGHEADATASTERSVVSAEQATATTATWTTVATENQPFTVNGTQTVRFGNEWYGWTSKDVTTSGQCSVAFFGSDPAVGRGKVCQVSSEAPTPPPPTTTTWQSLVSENQPFTVSGTQTVRFGNQWYGWVSKVVTNSGQCTVAFFGSDPAVGRGKVCELAVGSTPPPPPPPP